MKNLRILGLALVAVFALAALSVSTASAAPTINECAKVAKNAEKKYTGKYSDKLCSSEDPKHEGKYELQVGTGKKAGFKGKSGASELVVVVPPGVSEEFPGGATIAVKCGSSKTAGEVGSPNLVKKVVAEFKKCNAVGSPCQSGSAKEVIKTNNLAGELVDIETGSKVGSLLGAETGTSLSLFTCTELATTNVIGHVIAEQTGDVGVVSKEFTDHYVIGEGLGEPLPGYHPKVNLPTHKSGGANGEDILISQIEKGGKPQGELPSGQQQTAVQKGEAVEILP